MIRKIKSKIFKKGLSKNSAQERKSTSQVLSNNNYDFEKKKKCVKKI